MNRLAKLQLIGPGVMCAGLLAAEVASHALGEAPSSPMVWYMSQDLFAILRKSSHVLDADLKITQWPLLLIGLPLLSMAWYGFLFGRRLMLALATNLNLIYAFFVLCTGCEWWRDAGAFATMGGASWSGFLVGAALVSASLVSSFASHVAYIYAIRDEASWSPISSLPIQSS